jgi:Type II secretion system (T2SS), protein E, N-terminal domain
MQMTLALKSLLPARDLGWNRVRAVCGLPTCHNKLLTRYVPGSRVGIFSGSRWYCSPDCFAMASRAALAVLCSETVLEMPRNPRLSLGLALLAKGYLDEDQLRLATVRSQREGQTLETTLIECGWATEKQLAAARGAQWGYPVLGQDAGSLAVEADLPATLLRAYSAAPLHYSPKAKRLVLGFVYRVEHRLLQAIEQITGLRAEPCFITPTEFNEQIDRLAPVYGYREEVVENPGTVAQMARSLGGFAVEVSAREARFTKCNSRIWVRLAGKPGTVDIVFALKTAVPQTCPDASTVLSEITASRG